MVDAVKCHRVEQCQHCYVAGVKCQQYVWKELKNGRLRRVMRSIRWLQVWKQIVVLEVPHKLHACHISFGTCVSVRMTLSRQTLKKCLCLAFIIPVIQWSTSTGTEWTSASCNVPLILWKWSFTVTSLASVYVKLVVLCRIRITFLSLFPVIHLYMSSVFHDMVVNIVHLTRWWKLFEDTFKCDKQIQRGRDRIAVCQLVNK